MSERVTAERAREAKALIQHGRLPPSSGPDPELTQALMDLTAYIAQTEAREAALVELLTECRKAMARYDFDCYEEGVSMPYRERTLREEVDRALAAYRGDEES